MIAETGARPGGGTATATTGQRILVVDDSGFFRKLIQDALAGAGYAVTVAPDARTALELLHESPPDLVVTDLAMPDVDGFELLRRIRREWSPKQLPVLVVTEHVMRDEELEELESLGFRGCVNKFAPPDHIIFRANAALFAQDENARQNKRIAVSVPVQIRIGTSTSFAYSYNLCRDGMYVRSTDPPAPGTTLEVSFALPDRSRYLRVAAKVVHAQRRGEAIGVPPGFGVNFPELDEADARALNEFVDRTLQGEA